MTKYQNYNHYKLPITLNPLEYGRLIFSHENTYIIWITTKTICVITQHSTQNNIKFYRNGIFFFEYRDEFINHNTFSRSLNNYKYIFENFKLIKRYVIYKITAYNFN
jgi:hypothetical protein